MDDELYFYTELEDEPEEKTAEAQTVDYTTADYRLPKGKKVPINKEDLSNYITFLMDTFGDIIKKQRNTTGYKIDEISLNVGVTLASDFIIVSGEVSSGLTIKIKKI